MAGLDTALQLLTHPAVTPLLLQWISRPKRDAADRWDQLQARIDALETREIAGGGTLAGAPDLGAARDQVLAVSGSLKEALRFAREDGVTHPEAQQRIADAQRWLTTLPSLERFELAPERLAALPAPERAAWEGALPTIRRLRQAALNDLDTLEGLRETAGLAGQLGTALQVATVALGTPGGTWTPPASMPVVDRPDAAAGEPYSRYAPQMSRSTGCVECGRGHLTAVQAVLGAAATDARTKGPTHPDVQARLAFAQEELRALAQYDWTPEKLAQNPPAEQQALLGFQPQAQVLWEAARGAGTVDQIGQVAAQAAAMQQAYDRTFPSGGGTRFAHLVGRRPDVGPETVRVRPDRVFLLQNPTAGEVTAAAPPTDVPAAFDRLAASLAACGVPVRFRSLPATDDYLLEGEFDPATRTIALAPSAMSRDSYAVQTLVHEGVHALLHGPDCLPHPPADHEPYEQQAEDAVIATMVQSGLPIETREGRLITPTGRTVDWSAIEQEWGTAATSNLRWAADWLTQALDGAAPRLPVCETCPVPQEV